MMRPRRDSSRRLQGFARRMRSEATDTEKKLWSILRDRQLADFKFRRQHPMLGYVLDFYCVRAKLAVEADGGQHLDAQHVAYDARRDAALAGVGIVMMRFADDEVLKHPDVVAESIYERLVTLVPSAGDAAS